MITRLLALLALILNPGQYEPVLGVSYPVINTTTAAGLVALTDKAREELWVRRIVLGADRLYQDNPLSDNFTGRVNGARPDPKQLKKAVVELTETEKVAGNTINVPTIAGFGGAGVAGEGNRLGSEQKLIVGNFPVKIGRYWFGIGFTSVAKSETMIGGRLDQVINDGLRVLMAKKRSDDHMMRLRAAAGSGIGLRNNLLPSGVGTVAELTSSDVVTTTLISRGGEKLPGMGALPMDTTVDGGGSMGELYTLLSTDKALIDLASEPAYLAAIQNADVRGDANKCFKGGFRNWNGHGIYRWINRDHANRGPVGSPLLPRAFLGAVASGGTLAAPTGVDVTTPFSVASGSILFGGGNVYATSDELTGPNYFEFFSNAPYTYFNGDLIAADTSTQRYCQIINSNGTYGTFPFIENNGRGLLISGSALAVGDSTKRVTSFEKGAKIVECNVLGTPIGYSLYLGAEALVCGNGSINGSKVDAQMGLRSTKSDNYGMDNGVGIEAVWGNAVVARAGDGAYPNFLLVTHAISEDGAPTIA